MVGNLNRGYADGMPLSAASRPLVWNRSAVSAAVHSRRRVVPPAVVVVATIRPSSTATATAIRAYIRDRIASPAFGPSVAGSATASSNSASARRAVVFRAVAVLVGAERRHRLVERGPVGPEVGILRYDDVDVVAPSVLPPCREHGPAAELQLCWCAAAVQGSLQRFPDSRPQRAGRLGQLQRAMPTG